MLEDDGGCAAEDDADALGALAASMQRFLSATCAPPAWTPAVQLRAPPLLLRPTLSAPSSSPVVTEPGTLLHPPRAAVAAAARSALRQAASADSGPGWFNMAAPAITPDLKRDLRLLRLRGAFDPKRFYKSADSGRLPEHFAVRRVLKHFVSLCTELNCCAQIGTVVADASDFYSARLSKADRKARHLGSVCCLTETDTDHTPSFRDLLQRSSYMITAWLRSESAKLLRSPSPQQHVARARAVPPREKLRPGMRSAEAARDACSVCGYMGGLVSIAMNCNELKRAGEKLERH